MPEPVLPERPLPRFLKLLDELLAEKRWFEDASALRYAASSLLTLPGDSKRIARQLRALAEDLKQRAGWFGPLTSEVRFVVAAMLLQGGRSASDFSEDVVRIEGLFKERGLKRRNVFVQLAVLLLVEHARRAGRRVDTALVGRFGDLYDEMKCHHRFLTGQDDYPACALLAGLEGSPGEIGVRCERFYEGLRDLGFQRGNALQTVSHVLVFAPAADDVVMRRFRALYDRFDEVGLWMNTGDYDEVAALSFLDRPATLVVSKVLEHRAVLAQHPPKPGRQLSFSLACGTGFLELVEGEPSADLRSTQNVLSVQAIIQAQQAAMAACAASSAAAASSG